MRISVERRLGRKERLNILPYPNSARLAWCYGKRYQTYFSPSLATLLEDMVLHSSRSVPLHIACTAYLIIVVGFSAAHLSAGLGQEGS